jgi:hypothetical protein
MTDLRLQMEATLRLSRSAGVTESPKPGRLWHWSDREKTLVDKPPSGTRHGGSGVSPLVRTVPEPGRLCHSHTAALTPAPPGSLPRGKGVEQLITSGLGGVPWARRVAYGKSRPKTPVFVGREAQR